MSIDVLIADDSAFLRKVISEILSNQQSIKVIDRARNGIEAVEMVKKYRPDVLVLDLLMPKMNGIDALKLIMNEYPTPTIILSAINPQNMDASIQALLIGAFDYIIKPGGLGAKDLPIFRKELVDKVLLASKSQIKRIFQEKQNIFDRTTSFRQETVSEIFKFGQYLNKLKSFGEDDEIKDLKSINIEETELVPDKSDILRKETENKYLIDKLPIKTVNEQIEPVNKEIFDVKLDEIDKKKLKPIKKEKSKTLPKKREKVKVNLIKHKIKTIKPLKTAVEITISKKTSVIKKIKTNYIPDLIPIKRVHLKSNLIVIGASVGGPRTITTILKDIPKNFPCPILVVQHLTPQFINTFVNTLNDVCKITIKVAKNEEYIQTGIVYIAPGDNHMEVSVKNNNPCIKIYKGTPVHFCMPSIDVLFFSAACVYKNRIMAILLTGMGEDGVDGLDAIQKLGGKTITESQETCVLYGMPKLAKERGVVDRILPNNEIKDHIIKYAQYTK